MNSTSFRPIRNDFGPTGPVIGNDDHKQFCPIEIHKRTNDSRYNFTSTVGALLSSQGVRNTCFSRPETARSINDRIGNVLTDSNSRPVRSELRTVQLSGRAYIGEHDPNRMLSPSKNAENDCSIYEKSRWFYSFVVLGNAVRISSSKRLAMEILKIKRRC